MPDSTLPPPDAPPTAAAARSAPELESTHTDARAPEHVRDADYPLFAPGDRIGRYVILSSLGKGGMSVVFLAYDPELDRKVALKLMRVNMLGEKGRLRLQREAQALAKLSHPNVVPVYDAGTVGDQAFVAMEFVEGKTLRKWLKDGHDWREVLAVMMDAGRGLAAAHAAGLVHRDFKPDNVLMGEDGRVRVLDFGLARLASVLDGSLPTSTPSLDSDAPPSTGSFPSYPIRSEGGVPLVPTSAPSLVEVTRADQLIGTPAYMAPEQMRREATDAHADQFSFCVAAYEALFGKRPFDVDAKAIESAASTASLVELSRTALRAPKPVPRGTKVPGWVQRAIQRGLADDPAARWSSMDQLLRALGNDPRLKWRRVAAVTGVALLLAASAGAAVRAQSRTRAMCRGGEAHAGEVWGPSAKDDVAKAFARTGVPYAADATRAIGAALDDYATKWAAMDDEACVATRLRGEVSEEVLDLRMACLSDRLKEMGALVDVMTHADAETVQHASRAAQSLGPLSDCADIAALRAPTPRPRDPALAARIDALEKRLATVEANYAVGKSSDAARMADALLADAAPTQWGPLVAQAQFWRGRSYADLGESDKSVPSLRDAFAAALGSREERVLRWSAARLAQEYVYASEWSDYEYWAHVSGEALARSGPDADLGDFLANVRCVSMWSSGAVSARYQCFAKHAAELERRRPMNDWELVTIGLAASDAGELAKGVEYLRRGVQYSLATNGPAHPRTFEMRGYLSKGLLDYGDVDAAMKECSEALRQAEEVAPDNQYIIGRLRMYLGSALRQLHRYDDARYQLDLAKDHVSPPDEVLTEIALNEAGAGHAEESLAFLRTSLDEAAKALPPKHPNVIGSQIALGDAELEAADVKDARTLLDTAYVVAEGADLAPIMRADLDFGLARALALSKPPDMPRAIALATHARDGYATKAPGTTLYQNELRRIDEWLASATAKAAPRK